MLKFTTKTFLSVLMVTLVMLSMVIPTSIASVERPGTAFKDVSRNHWAYGSIQEGYKKGIVTGYLDGTFKPDQKVTRAEIVMMLARVINRDYEKKNKYNDVIGHWAEAEMDTLSDMGIAKGSTPDGLFNPNAKATRSESLLMILHMLNISLDHSLDIE